MGDEDTTILHKMIVDQLKRSEANQVRIFDKLDEQGQTLGRLTTTVEIHQKFSENLEKEQKSQRSLIGDIEEEVSGLKDHVKEVRLWIKILKPTKVKLATLALLGSIFGGNEARKLPSFKKFINGFYSTEAKSSPSRVTPPTPKPLDSEPTAP